MMQSKSLEERETPTKSTTAPLESDTFDAGNSLIGPPLPPGTPDAWVEQTTLSTSRSRGLIASSTLRHVRLVSQRAALATKKQIWDSNDASIVAAQSAVDQWEQGYNALRGLLVAMGHSAHGLYGAAKAGANGLEHGFLLPVRDWVLLPAFGGVEKVASETVGFLQSSHAEQLAHQSLGLIKQMPFVGENILAPALCIGADVLKQSWEIAQYPIPSPSQVHDSVDFVMTGTKWALTTTVREVSLYVKRADANITRTLSHTQWKVLGSGPYATLDKLNKREVIDHLCERYFSLQSDAVARYELAAHIRAHNRPLYHDLVFTGLLRERGGDLTKEDEWLSTCPSYRGLESPFLLDESDAEQSTVMALWFRLPYHNGKRPGKDTPWVQLDLSERNKLEPFYMSTLHKYKSCESSTTQRPQLRQQEDSTGSTKYPTIASWYKPDLANDLLLNQKRHAVSLFSCCPKCRKPHIAAEPPLVPRQFGELCTGCTEGGMDAPWVDTLLSPPPLSASYRPTMWRFYGPGDELRRAIWFLDTQRGLQPYGEGAQAVLEDAYLFLKWMSRRRVWDGDTLLTVQVPSPDGKEHQLVQFSSLTSATAIGKGLGGAIALFKRRVYRGAYFSKDAPIESEEETSPDTSDRDDTVEAAGDKSTVNDAQVIDRVEDGHVDEGENDHWVAIDDSTSSLLQESEDVAATTNTEIHERPDRGCTEKVAKSSAPTAENRDINEAEPLDGMISLRCDDFSLAFPLSTSGQEDGHTGTVDDENVDHLVLIVHGIGEMLQSIDFFGLSKIPTIVDCCGFLRKNHDEVLKVRFNQLYETLDGFAQPRRGRVEYLPVEWHESFTIQSRRRHHISNASGSFNINDVSLRTIPQLRQFANDTLMDVLYFMSPEHHDIITDIVVNEMNFVVANFRSLTGFTGDVSIVGHSLGSIITWDILDHQLSGTGVSNEESSGQDNTSEAQSSETSYMTNDSKETRPVHNETLLPAKNLSGGEAVDATDLSAHHETETPSQACPGLSFKVDNAFMLGSPIAVFLMIRNQRKPLSKEFTLGGCPRVFNIFHPYDPVAYRIEPLLDPRNADIEPRIMTHWHGGLRFQYQTKRLWRQIVEQTLKTQESVVESLESGIAALGLLDGAAYDIEEEEEIEFDYGHTVVTGNLNCGQRIDYMLQEKEIENANEYVAALAAHSCYWLEKDLSLFIARQICLRALEREAGEGVSFSRHNSFLRNHGS